MPAQHLPVGVGTERVPLDHGDAGPGFCSRVWAGAEALMGMRDESPALGLWPHPCDSDHTQTSPV